MIGAGVCKRTLAVISFVGDGNNAGANANMTASVVRCIAFRGNVSRPSTEKASYLLVPLLLSTLLGVIRSFPCYEAGDSPGSSYNVLPSTLVGVVRLLVLQYTEHLSCCLGRPKPIGHFSVFASAFLLVSSEVSSLLEGKGFQFVDPQSLLPELSSTSVFCSEFVDIH
jgi:hypothetical protein